MKTGWLQIIPHGHSGRLREHGHTSYRGLAFVLLLAGLLLGGATWQAQAAAPAVNPQSGSVGLTGTVRGPAPSQAAVITSPRNGDHTSTIPITVAGSCPAGTFVQIMRNEIFAGAVTCADNGTFSLQIDLFDGQNTLIARVSDALGQFGPDSAAVVVFYDAPSLSLPGGAIGRQLFLETTVTVQGGSPQQPLTRTVTIVGGTGPYAVSWDWGDGKTSLVSQAGEGPVSATHTYDRAGNYRVIVQVSDSASNSAFLQLVTIINGPLEAVGANGGTGLGALPGALVATWPLFTLMVFFVGAFWLGERRERNKLKAQGRLVS
jgi:hypothetical protein